MNYRKVMLIGCIGTMVIFGGCKKEVVLESKPIEATSNVNVATPKGNNKPDISKSNSATDEPKLRKTPISEAGQTTVTPELKAPNDARIATEYIDPDRFQFESFGSIKLGLSKKQIIEIFGEPEETTPIKTFPRREGYYQGLNYKKEGISIEIVGEKVPEIVSSFRLESPCYLKSSRSIGIGSTKEDVDGRYKDGISAYNDTLSNHDIVSNRVGAQPSINKIFVGSPYNGCIAFSLENGKVKSISVGYMAEEL